MSHEQSAPKSTASFWLETPARQKRTDETTSPDRTRSVIRPGFLVHARMLTMREDLKRSFFGLDRMRQKRSGIADRLAQKSASKDEAVLRFLRSDQALALAEFYYAIHALGLSGPNDSLVLLDLHNARVAAMAKRGDGSPFHATFTDSELLHFEEIWRASPGSLEDVILARFLGAAIPKESVEPLLTACEAAGFVSRKIVYGACLVSSTRVVEAVVQDCLSEIGLKAAGF